MRQKLILKLSVLAFCLSLALPVPVAAGEEQKPVAAGQAQKAVAAGQDQNTTSTDRSPPLQNFLGQSRSCSPPTQAEIDLAVQQISAGNRELPQAIKDHRQAWLEYSIYFRHMHYFIAISTIVFSALATALKDGEAVWNRWKTVAAVLATITAGISSTLAPYADFKKFDSAFVVLNTAQAEYITNPFVSLCDVGNAIAYGEGIIHRGE